MRDLLENEVTFTLTAEQCDLPVRGNAMASGDDEQDAMVENAILYRLECGDVWAWAQVTVTATWIDAGGTTHTGVDYLGGCCYKDEADFRTPGGYFDDMKHEALRDLNDKLRAAVERGQALERELSGGDARERPACDCERPACARCFPPEVRTQS